MSKKKSTEVQDDPKLEQNEDLKVDVKVEDTAKEEVKAGDTAKEEVEVKAGKEEKKTKRGRKTKKSKEELLQEQNDQLAAELAEMKDKYLRQYAEFDNFRKRTNKERFELMKTAAKDTLVKLLPVVDDFDRAVKAAADDENIEPLSEGVMLVYDKMKNILGQTGLKEMQTTGEIFNPDLHDALTEIPAPTEEMKGKIIDTIEKGYQLNDTIIRHARVIVGK